MNREEARYPRGGRSRREFYTAAAVSLFVTTILLVGVEWCVPGHPRFDLPIDHHKYIHMAQTDIGAFHVAPFCWRIGSPFLSKVLPLDLMSSFIWSCFMALWITGITVHYILKAFGFSQIEAISGMLLFFAFPEGPPCAMHGFWVPDALSYLFVALPMFLAITGRDTLFALSLLVGVTIKESTVFAVPLYYTLRTRKLIDFKLGFRTALLALPSIVLVFLIRAAIPALNDNDAYMDSIPLTLSHVHGGIRTVGYLAWLREIGARRIESLFSFYSLRLYTVNAFSYMLVFAVLAFRKNMPWLLRFSPYLLLVFAQLLFAVNTGRLLFMAFPATVLFSLNGLRAYSQRLRVSALPAAGLALLLLGVNLLWVPRWMMPTIQFALSVLCLAMFAAAVTVYRRTWGRATEA